MNMYIQCPCGNTHRPNTIETLNIEEDIYGRDLITYICPVTNTQQKALVLIDTSEENLSYWSE